MQRQSLNRISLENEIALLQQIIALKPRSDQLLQSRLAKLRRAKLSIDTEKVTIEQIDLELNEIYDIKKPEKLDENFDFYHFHSLALGFISPRVRYLLDKRRDLIARKKIDEPTQKEKLAQLEIETPQTTLKTFLLTALHKASVVYNVVKKIVDVIDDAWRIVMKPLKAIVPPKVVSAVTPFLVGSTNLFIHFCEGVEGLIDAIKAIRKTKTVSRKTKITTGFLIAAIGATGTGLSASYIASAAGAFVLGAQFMPVIIPALLTGIFITGLWKNSHILHSIKHEYQNEKAKLEQLRGRLESITKTNSERFNNLEEAKHHYISQRNRILFKLADLNNVDIETQEKLAKIDYNLNSISRSQLALETQINEADDAVKNQTARAEKLKEKKLAAERDVAFKTIELTASLVVLTGTILGTAAILGAASVATLGALPLAIVIVGVAIGISCKLFEYIDRKHNHKYSNGIRNFFTNTIGGLFGSKKKQEAVTRPTSSPRVNDEALEQSPLLRHSDRSRQLYSTARMIPQLGHSQHSEKPDASVPLTSRAKPIIAPTVTPTVCDPVLTSPVTSPSLLRARY